MGKMQPNRYTSPGRERVLVLITNMMEFGVTKSIKMQQNKEGDKG